MKRIFIGLLIILGTTSLLFSQYTLSDSDVEVIDGVVQSCSYDFSESQVIIPGTLDGQTVIGIADKDYPNGVFQNKGITSVNIPGSVKYIGDYAFYGNTIDLWFDWNDFDSIGDYAFYNEGNGNTVTFLTTYLKSIGDYAFYGYSILQGEKLWGLKHIGHHAFYNCNISSYDMSLIVGVEFIGDSAFYRENGSLQSVDLRGFSALTEIGVNAFGAGTFSESAYLILPMSGTDGFNYLWTDLEDNKQPGGNPVSHSGAYSATLVPAYDVSIIVEHESTPVWDAAVTLNHYGADRIGYTNYAGECIFAKVIPETDMAFKAEHPHYISFEGNVTVIDSDIQENVELSLKSYSVNFTITDGNNPIQGATVVLSGYDSLTSDEAGKVTFTDVMPEEDIAYTVVADNFETYSDSITVAYSDIQENVVLSLKSYSVYFTVTDGNNPIQGATVMLDGYSFKITDTSGIAKFIDVLHEEDIAYSVIANNFGSSTGTVSAIEEEVVVDVVLISTVSVADFEVNNIKVYPNPVSDILFIKVADENLIKDCQIRIINQLGVMVFETNVEEPLYEINLSTWSGTGLYFVQVIDTGGNIIHIRKIVLQ